MWGVETRIVSVSFSLIICVLLYVLCGSSFCCLVFRVWRIVHHAVLGRLSRFSCLCNSVWVTVPKNSRSCCRCDSNRTDKTKTGFWTFFWLLCTQESPASHEWITCDVWKKTSGQIRCIPPRWATVSAFVRCDLWLVCDHVAVERCGTAQVANVSHVRC